MMTDAFPEQVEPDGILEYQYEPLVTDDHVRLLILDPAGRLEDPLRCSIVQYDYYAELCSNNNTHHRHFAAVSYTWGSSVPTHQLQIDKPSVSGTEDAASTFLKITATVDSLLCHLRKPHKAVPLWIDAVCLNQMDPREKAQQVPNMGHIYRAAKKVHIWLGDDNIDDARRVFSIVREVEIRNEWNPTPDEVTLLSKFFDISWFTRRWIVQEAVLAHEAVLQCGTNSIALSWLLRALKKAHFGASGLNALGYGPEMLLYSVGKYQEAPDGCGLLSLLWDLHLSECSDDRDRVAAFWGLTSSTSRPNFLLYDQGASQMYWDCAKYLAQRGDVSAHTLILHLVAFGSRRRNTQNSSVPSWVPDWSRSRRPLMPYIDGLHAVLTSIHGSEMLTYETSSVFAKVRKCRPTYLRARKYRDFNEYCESFNHKTQISVQANSLRIVSHPILFASQAGAVMAVFKCESCSWQDVWFLLNDYANSIDERKPGIMDATYRHAMLPLEFEAIEKLLAAAHQDICGEELPVTNLEALFNSIRLSGSPSRREIEGLEGIGRILSRFALLAARGNRSYALGPYDAEVGDFLVPFSTAHRDSRNFESPWSMEICLRPVVRGCTESGKEKMYPAMPFCRTVQWVGLTLHDQSQRSPWLSQDTCKKGFKAYCNAMEHGLPGPYVFDVI